MKGFLISLLTLISIASEASANRVGDAIAYSGNFGGQSAELHMAYTSFDGSYMTQGTKMFLGGQLVSDTEEALEADSIVTMDTVGVMIAMCSQIGGVQEYLDLPVGKTLTCRVEASSVSAPIYEMYKDVFMDASTIWFGPFPVTGIAQMIFNGATFQVSGYHWN